MKKAANFLKPHRITAFLIYFAVCLSLYIIHSLYNGALKSILVYIFIYPIYLIFFTYFSSEKIEKTDVRKKIEAVASWVLAITAVTFTGYYIYANPYFLTGYQILAVFISILVMQIFKPDIASNHKTSFISIIYSSILFITVVYLLIAKPSTVYKAENNIMKEGGQNISYVMLCQDKISLTILLNNKISDVDGMAKKLGIYIFYCEINNENYGVYVDVASGKIIYYEKTDENSILSNIIQSKLFKNNRIEQ